MKERLLGLIGLLLISGSLCAMLVQAEAAQTKEVQDELNQRLIGAAKVGDASLARELLNRGALLSVHDQFGYSPFEWAAIHGHIECLYLFLDDLQNNIQQANQTFRLKDNVYRAPHPNLEKHYLMIPFFQRNIRSLFQLTKCIQKIYDTAQIDTYFTNQSYQRILGRLEVQLSLNIVLSCFSSDDDVLQQELRAAGAETITHAHLVFLSADSLRSIAQHLTLVCADSEDSTSTDIGTLRKQKHLDRLLRFAIKEDNENLFRALLRAGAPVDSVDKDSMQPLHLAVELDRACMVQLLLEGGAPKEQRNWHGLTPWLVACKNRSIRAGQRLLESGASMNGSFPERAGSTVSNSFNMGIFPVNSPVHIWPRYKEFDKHQYYEMLLQACTRRYTPTKREARIALQMVAQLVHCLGIHLNLPAYCIYEVLLFAAAEQRNKQGRVIAPQWTKALKKALEVIYLYKRNGGKLLPLWEQSISCMVKDEIQRSLLISKLENYIRPFLGNEVIPIVCSSLMDRVAQESKQYPVRKPNDVFVEEAFFGEDCAFYYKHLEKYLKIDGFDTPCQ